MILNPKVFAKVSKKCIVKFSSIVRYQYSGHPNRTQNVFPDEVLDILLCDFC